LLIFGLLPLDVVAIGVGDERGHRVGISSSRRPKRIVPEDDVFALLHSPML
jgi:hypothetical protein